jgi:hypothetical protein
MAGLVPAIHVLEREKKDVDARHKAGHDDLCYFALTHRAFAQSRCQWQKGDQTKRLAD